MSTYQPEQWRDFFVTVGGGAAALTGLAVVAMSMHVRIITMDPILRHRARMMLASLGAVFMRCSLALMGGQDNRGVGVVLFVGCLVVTIMGLFSYAPVATTKRAHRSSLLRTVGSILCYCCEMVGAALLFSGLPWGLNVAAIAMVTNFFFVIGGAWLLLIGIHQDEARSL